MPLIKCLATIPYFTGAPEDVATNTTYFVTPEGTSLEASWLAAGARLNSFYTAIGSYFSNVIANQVNVKYYDMADPAPRLPIGTSLITVSPTAAAQNLPEEVAVVLSFSAAPVSGANMARRRGRIYLGPLNFSAITSSTGDSLVQVNPPYRTAIATAATAMANTTTSVAAWVVYSQADNAPYFIKSGWIDVQPDVQRRRGHKLSGRTTWSAP
jgi:hypothetical protein